MKKFTIVSLLTVSLLVAACGKPVQPDPSDQEKVRNYNTLRDVGPAKEDPVHGKQVQFSYGPVSGTGSTNANGVAFFRTFGDGVSVITVNANIAKAELGNIHVAWLTDSAKSRFVRIGALTSIIGDVRHSASLESKDDLSGLQTVLVTLEASETPETPGIVKEAEGVLKTVTPPAQ